MARQGARIGTVCRGIYAVKQSATGAVHARRVLRGDGLR